MATTRMPGITIVAGGQRFIDKRHRGVRIAMRVGNISQEQAEQRLQTEMSRVDCELLRKAHTRPHFIDCAARYLAQCKDKRSVETIRRALRAEACPDAIGNGCDLNQMPMNVDAIVTMLSFLLVCSIALY